MSTITVSPTFAPAGRAVSSHPRPEASRVRLTRRGRLVVMAASLAAIGIVVVGFGPSVVATGERGEVTTTSVVTVQAGQTLWQIAAEANPGADPRETVDDIMRMNSLSSAGELQMGSELAVPVYE